MIILSYAGVLGLVWSVMWWFLVYDTPAKHPRIMIEEREYIEKALATRKGAKVCSAEFDIKIYSLCSIRAALFVRKWG